MGLLLILLVVIVIPSQAQEHAVYNIGSPILTDIYVSISGDDAHDGLTVETPLRTLTEAWNRIPAGESPNETGYHIWLLPGTYAAEDAPNYWESRYGTYEYPILIEALDGRDTVYLPHINLFDSRYLYFSNVNIETGGDAFHCERCDHLLLRGVRLVGADPDTYNAQETLKVNQSQYVYVEDSDISGAWDNAVDFVAVQYGHFLNNRIHNAGDWCMYLKGGSAYFRVEGNELYDCGTGGFTAGQGTGFQFMTPPWIQYEAYDIEFVNNVVHDTSGAGVGVQGGYGIVIAGNTFYRVGERSHLVEFGYGSRSCDGQAGDEGRARCDEFAAQGGWGNSAVADGENYVRIPNRHVYFYNNVIYNPAGYQSAYQHFTVFAPYDGAFQAESGVPLPARADDDLQIRGNVIWNGGVGMPLGIEANPDFPSGCQADNPTCNEAQIRADNAINTVEPVLNDPANGNYDHAPGWTLETFAIPTFEWDVPVPAG